MLEEFLEEQPRKLRSIGLQETLLVNEVPENDCGVHSLNKKLLGALYVVTVTLWDIKFGLIYEYFAFEFDHKRGSTIKASVCTSSS